MSFKERQLFSVWVGFFVCFGFMGVLLVGCFFFFSLILTVQFHAKYLYSQVNQCLVRAVLGHEYNIYILCQKTEFLWMRCFPWHDVLACQLMSQSALLPSASLLHGLLDVSSVALQGFWGRSLMHLLLVQLLSQQIAVAAVGCHFFMPTFYQHGFCSGGGSASEVVQPLIPG